MEKSNIIWNGKDYSHPVLLASGVAIISLGCSCPGDIAITFSAVYQGYPNLKKKFTSSSDLQKQKIQDWETAGAQEQQHIPKSIAVMSLSLNATIVLLGMQLNNFAKI